MMLSPKKSQQQEKLCAWDGAKSCLGAAIDVAGRRSFSLRNAR
jgi:hypothetical protein